MNQRDDQPNSNLQVSGYGPRVKRTLVLVIVLAVIVAAIVLAAIWANSRDPEVGVQPTPRPTQVPKPTATTVIPDTPTPEPTEPEKAMVAETATPGPTEAPAEDTPTSTVEPTSEPTATPEKTPESEESATPEPEGVPTPKPTEEPTAVPTDTPVPPTETPAAEPTATATEVLEPTPTPTNTPVPPPTATPTITPTPLPEVPTRLEIYARGNLIDQGIDQSGIKVLNVEEHTWSDLTLGCGSIDDDNPARPVEGWVLTLGNDEQSYTFHIASKDQGDAPNLDEDIILNCTDVGETQQLTINLVHELRLHEARRVILYRGPADGEQMPIQDIQDPVLVQEIINALSTTIPIGNTDSCQTAFRLDFHILRGIETIRFFCDEDWFRVEGEQEIWGGTQGANPQELLDSVAKYFANQPLPQIPTFTPSDE